MAKATDAAKKKVTKKKAATASKGTSAGSWFQRGKAGAETQRKLTQQRKSKAERSAFRFFLKPGESAKLVFVDPKKLGGFYCYVHQLQLNGSWNNFFTCSKELDICPVCDQSGKHPTYTAHYTVIDTRKIEGENRTYENEVRLYPAKGPAIDILAEYATKLGDLHGVVFEVKRYTDKDSNCGVGFTRVGTKRVDVAKKFGADKNKTLNYEKILALPTEEELEASGLLGTGTPIANENESHTPTNGDKDDLFD